jgi:hypothetical protein
LKELSQSSLSLIKSKFYEIQETYNSINGKFDDYYLKILLKSNEQKQESVRREGKFQNFFKRVKEIFPSTKYKIDTEKDEVIREIYKKELLNIKIYNELRMIRFKNVFAESFFIRKNYIVEKAFNKIQKESLNIDKHYTIFYKLYKITSSQIHLSLKKSFKLIPLIMIGSFFIFRYAFYKKTLHYSNNKKIHEKEITLFGKDLDKKFIETYLIELDLIETSVTLNDYVKNKEILEKKYKNSHPNLIEFFDELMMSDLRLLMSNIFFGFFVFTISFIYSIRKKKFSWQKSLFTSFLYFYLFREISDYAYILQYVKNQDQLSRFILQKGDLTNDNLDEIFKYQFFRKNLNNL